ncbi:S1C family serine protease [Planctomicrobium piriforme]|uniref:Trypsin-like peptidase domain-containing protein n=1 Tax=Planctomicrobium piriforme TaxID=1576369 RepID=A0A1I3IDE9_9PLAN|nr:S1C family serine protease [Planctomicrobium piriforme]SFI45899.1 Trypsin-like peptidase domain-containing protein [Planctomicrobium piriforme]
MGSKRRKNDSENNSGTMSGALIGGGAVALVAFGLYVAGGQNGSMPWENNAAQQQSIAPPPPVSSVAPPPPVTQPAPSQPAAAAVGNEFSPPPNMGSGAPLPPGTVMPTAASSNGSTPTPAPTIEPKTEFALIALIERVEPAVVRIQVKTRSGDSIGSGFLIDKDGTIVTNYHVIAGAASAEAEFRDGRKVPVEGFYGFDQNRDLAILKIAPQVGVEPLPVATEIPPKGTRVAAFGAPRGLSFTASEGIVSAIRSAKEAKHEDEALGTVVQTTAPISPGNSGGPLVNMFGEVVAANTFTYVEAQNLNFGISCPDINDVISKKSMTLTPLSPEALPEEESSYIKGAQKLAGTERGRVLLSQIREAAVLTLPLSYDPTGRLMDFVLANADRTISTKLKWKTIVRSRDFKGSTALVLMIAYLEDSAESDVAAADLVIRTRIYCRDVDKDGREFSAIVYDKEETVCKATAAALAQGIVSRRMETGVKDYFNHLATEYRTAIRQVEPK